MEYKAHVFSPTVVAPTDTKYPDMAFASYHFSGMVW